MMFLGIALLSGLLVAPAVQAVPSGPRGRLVRRSESFRSQLNNRPEQTNGGASGTLYSQNWAGAVWNKSDGTFDTVAGTFTVPVPSGSLGASGVAWVGIDGETCTSAILQTGILFTVESGQPTYSAWWEWYPAEAYKFPDINISSGDVVRLSVVALSANSGTATVENLSNGQVVSKNLNSTSPLCGRNAEWIVEDYAENNGTLVPFADFGTVAFTNAVATGPGKRDYYPSGATIIDIEQNGQVLTSVSTNEASVTIQYV